MEPFLPRYNMQDYDKVYASFQWERPEKFNSCGK